jgi:hypothetical protein
VDILLPGCYTPGGMPNQRSKGKVHLGAYVERSLKLRILAIAAEREKSLTALLTEILEAEVSRCESQRLEEGRLGKSSSSTSRFPAHREEASTVEERADPKKKKTGT